LVAKILGLATVVLAVTQAVKIRIVLLVVLSVLFPLLAFTQEIKLPVFFLRYDGGVGSEEIEPEEGEEEEIEASSQRHKVTLRIKEEWGPGVEAQPRCPSQCPLPGHRARSVGKRKHRH